jgi:triacylglycerol lipase
MAVNAENCPVVLVHGWKSHPGIWKPLIHRLENASIPFWNFSHAGLKNSSPAAIAAVLQDYIRAMREDSGYAGDVDIVCHSMGACIVRYLLEVLDGNTRYEQVRQLIGLGPLNNGSAMAELFNHPEFGPQVISRLTGVFVPQGYDPKDDIIVQEVRPASRTMAELQAAGVRDDISYRLILTANTTATPDLFPWFEGKTWEFSPENGWQMTYAGDGIVPHTESYLPGAGFDILPAEPVRLSRHPDHYCHLGLPRNEEVIDRVMEYLANPATPPTAVCPDRTAGYTRPGCGGARGGQSIRPG